jgi:hypothetical protein
MDILKTTGLTTLTPETLNETKVIDIAHRICSSGRGLVISAVEPTTAGVNEFWSGDQISVNVV